MMWNPVRVGGFEKRLLIFFLLLSVTPTLIIAVFSARYFVGTVQLVSNPAVEASFENSVEIARDFSARLEADAAEGVRRFGAHPRLTPERLEVVVRQSRTDFAAVYERSGSAWRLAALHPAGLSRIQTVLDGSEPFDAEPRAIRFADPDIIASAASTARDTLLVAGFLLDQGQVEMLRKTGDDLGRYRAVGLYVKILRRYIIIMTCVLVIMVAVSSTVLSRVFARRISLPIRELAVGTQQVAKGDLAYRVRVAARDEIATLVADFNNMTQELQENRNNLIAMARREAQVAREYEIARQVQASLFPDALPEEPGWEFAARCRPARAVGGDYYDAFEIAPGKVLFAQGDVSGKGVGASLVMASVHAVVRSNTGALEDGLSKLVQDLNHYLISSSTLETFVTLFVGVLDCKAGRLAYVNCGHPPAIILSAAGTPQAELRTGGPVLGVISDYASETGECVLAPGETLVVVSDGVTEAMNPREDMFETEGLLRVLAGTDGMGASQTMDRIIGAVDSFMEGTEQSDDISILVMHRK